MPEGQNFKRINFFEGFFTTDEEVERVAATVELLAAHDPATLPPRARLTILGQGER